MAAAVLTAAVWGGLLNSADGVISDSLYHKPQPVDGEIVIIGMDQYAIDLLGPFPWPRSYMAWAVEYLNADPENRPAVIGIDVLYVGSSQDPEGDSALAEACRRGGNVVVASAATFGADLVTDDEGEAYIDSMAILAWDEPYDELKAAAKTGHINAMPDKDSVVRHAMYTIDVPGVGSVKPFARVVYEEYCKASGLEAGPEPKADNGFFYLSYSGAPGAYYDGISFGDLIEETVDPSYFADKIVLIGPYTMGMQDEYRTSIDHASPMYGVEIQANQIEVYRSGFLPQEVSKSAQLALLFALTALMTYLFLDASMKKAIAGWLICSGLWIGISAGAYKAGYVLHVLWIPACVTAMFVACVGLNYIRSQLEKRKISNTFSRYVDPAIIKELLNSGSAAETLGGKNFDIAVLFVDIRGFTTMSESLPPATVVEIINKYLTLTTNCIMRYHGTLDKFVGDCTMAFWNAPVPQEDCVYLACRAAMDMVIGSKPLAEELEERFGRSVSFGVGVHYGPAVVGNIGAPQRMDFTAIGDTVNTASRLESNAPAGTVYISRVVADILGNRAKTTSLGGSIKLKGKAEGFEVLTLDSLE